MEGVFHAGADDVVAAENEGVEDEGAGDDGGDEGYQTKGVFEDWVPSKKRRFSFHSSILA